MIGVCKNGFYLFFLLKLESWHFIIRQQRNFGVGVGGCVWRRKRFYMEK